MSGSQSRQLIYLVLAISGTVLTQRANWQFIQETVALLLANSLLKPEPLQPGNR